MKTVYGLVSMESGKAVVYNLGGTNEGKLREIRSYDGDVTQFYKEVAREITDYTSVILAGHGKDSAHEARNFWDSMRGQNKPIAKKIIGVLTTDYYETEKQLLAWADELVGIEHIEQQNG